MRRATATILALFCSMLLGCTPQDAPESKTADLSPQDAVRRAATAAFGVSDSMVTSEYRTNPQANRGSWNIVVTMESVHTTAALDKAAADVLATVASVDGSETPVSLSVIGKALSFPGSEYEWGALNYWWARLDDPSYPRGTDVSLAHCEAQAPGNPVRGGILASEIRGHWQHVDGPTLERWAEEGPPDPTVAPSDTRP